MSGELSVSQVHIVENAGVLEYLPEEGNTNYYRQQATIFSPTQKHTKSTPEVDNIVAFISDKGASSRDLNAFDIAFRSVNLSGPKYKETAMYKFFQEINVDDFTDGKFDKTKSDGKVQLFSAEKDGTYGIIDKLGNVYKFNSDGSFLSVDAKKAK